MSNAGYRVSVSKTVIRTGNARTATLVALQLRRIRRWRAISVGVYAVTQR